MLADASLLWLLLPALFAGVVGLYLLQRRRDHQLERPARRRALRAWAERHHGTYSEDIALAPGLTASERVVLTLAEVDLVVSFLEGAMVRTRVVATESHGRARSGSLTVSGRDFDDSRLRRLSPFDQRFCAEGDAVPDDATKDLALALGTDLPLGLKVLEWSGKSLTGTLLGHEPAGPRLDALCALVAHVVKAQRP